MKKTSLMILLCIVVGLGVLVVGVLSSARTTPDRVDAAALLPSDAGGGQRTRPASRVEQAKDYLVQRQAELFDACSRGLAVADKSSPPTTVDGLPITNEMLAFLGPDCVPGYVQVAPDGSFVNDDDHQVRASPSHSAEVVGYLVPGVAGWFTLDDDGRFDSQVLRQAELELTQEAG